MNAIWSRAAALFFLVWAVANTVFSVIHYGPETGTYFWFCNLGLWLLAAGFFLKSRSLLIAFLSTAIFTQSLLIIDNIWRVFLGKNLLGVIEYMYQPGVQMPEFLLAHYHYFMIPTVILALCFWPKEKPL